MRALQRRRDAALAEQEAAQAAFDEVQTEWLRAELERAEMAYAQAAAQARDTYCRVRAVFWRLKLAMGDAGKGMTQPDVNIRLPRIGTFAAFDTATGTAHLDAAGEAVKVELTQLTGGGA